MTYSFSSIAAVNSAVRQLGGAVFEKKPMKLAMNILISFASWAAGVHDGLTSK
jgi:hypothetical protein